MASLTTLANQNRCDKGTEWSFRHKYTYLYDLLFWPYRDASINFLELGLAVGGPDSNGGLVERSVDSPSVSMWLAYFSNATIHGFDISDFSRLRHERFRFVRGDAGVSEDLDVLAGSAPHFDIIIDDASHASYHQQLALKMLWPRLSPGGLYIIEDLHWQSPVYEASMPSVPLTRDFLVAWFESGEYWPNALFSPGHFLHLASQVETFAAFPAFNAGPDPSVRLPDSSAKLIVLRKCL
jgi:hypothetical protein